MSRHPSLSHSLLPSAIACALLLVLAFLQLSSLAVTSVTIDEPSHVMAGYAFLARGDTRLMLNGPILPNALGAAPLRFWCKGDAIAQIQLLTILAGTPAGEYELRLGVYNRQTNQRVTLLESALTDRSTDYVMPGLIQVVH